MNFGIGIEIDLEADKYSKSISDFSKMIQEFLYDKNYGHDIENMTVGIICLRPVEGFEEFSKVRKPKYIANKVIKLIDGSSEIIERSFSYDIKFGLSDYEQFVAASSKDSYLILIRLFIDSLSNFDSLPKKVKSFDVEAFKDDVSNYLRKLHGHI